MFLGASQFLYILSISCLLITWVLTRKSRIALPSDIFIIALITVFSPAILFNPEGLSSFAEQTYDPSVAASGIFIVAFSIIFLTVGLFVGLIPQSMLLRKGKKVLILHYHVAEEGVKNVFKFSLVLLCIFALGGVLELAEAKDLVLYLTGQLDNEEYSTLRRFEHVGGNPIDIFSERFRYSLVALVLLYAASFLIFTNRIVLALALYSASFILFAGGLSKQMISIFILYFIILLSAKFLPNIFNARKLVFVPFVLPIILLASLAPLFLLQYPDVFHGSIFLALDAAFYRVFVVPYTDVLTYLEVYPSRHPFTGLLGSSLLSAVFELEFRDILTEVAIFHFGADRHTTVTTAFFASAWAMGGYFSVAVQAFLVGCYLRVMDAIIVSVRLSLLRVTLYTVMMVNCTLWLQVPLLTGAFSYGLVIVPVTVLLIDYVFRKRQSIVFETSGNRSRH